MYYIIILTMILIVVHVQHCTRTDLAVVTYIVSDGWITASEPDELGNHLKVSISNSIVKSSVALTINSKHQCVKSFETC